MRCWQDRNSLFQGGNRTQRTQRTGSRTHKPTPNICRTGDKSTNRGMHPMHAKYKVNQSSLQSIKWTKMCPQ